ncbi:hypothetical protein [Providencia manganoxydans]|uniref:hypothetical protein n=1 Tax=Providencia manganoxydans TaxID=2923283 RepID=UPI0034E5C512
MGDYLKGNVGVNRLKPQHEYFDVIGVTEALNGNIQYDALITTDEATGILYDIKPQEIINPYDREAKLKERERRNNPFMKIFNVTDPFSPYAGTLRDAPDLYVLIREFGRLGITATEYVGPNGNRYIRISGYAGVRRIVTGTRYGAAHPTMLTMGIGQQGLEASIANGIRFCLVFSAIYRGLEWFFKDEYAFADFLGNITVDMAKTALIAAASWGIGTFLLGTALLGGSIIAVAGIVFVVGFAVAIGLEYLDNKYQISEKVIELLKTKWKREVKPTADIHKALHIWPKG